MTNIAVGILGVVTKGNTNHSLLFQKFSTNFRMIDTGALDHMTCYLQILSNYESCDQGIVVFMVDGTTSLANGQLT